MEQRNRAEGWQHAKLSGHENEELVKERLDTDAAYAQAFLKRLGMPGEKIRATEIGGLHETNVPSVNGKRKTKSKTDLKIFLESGRVINISIKKSQGGQVYFVGVSLFIDTFEKQFGRTIPDPVKRGLQLFWAGAKDAVQIIEQYADKAAEDNYDLQLRHKSLNATTLKAYDKELHRTLLAWFRDNAYELTKLSFAMGAARDQEEWSEYVWYINLLGEHQTDAIFSIEALAKAVAGAAADDTAYSTKNGGTTILLPFGFVQWHQKKMQFHHKYAQISKLLK